MRLQDDTDNALHSACAAGIIRLVALTKASPIDTTCESDLQILLTATVHPSLIP